MPLKNGYIQHGKVFKDGKFELLPVEPRGEISIHDIQDFIEKYQKRNPFGGEIKVGIIAPFTCLRVVE